MKRNQPDRRVRYLVPSAIPERFAVRVLAIGLEACLVFCLVSLVALRDVGTAFFEFRAVAVGVAIMAICFTLSVPLNEWIRRRWIAIGVITTTIESGRDL